MANNKRMRWALALVSVLCACAFAFVVVSRVPSSVSPAADDGASRDESARLADGAGAALDDAAAAQAGVAGDDDPTVFEPGVALVVLEEGVTADTFTQTLADDPAFAGIEVAEAGSSIVVLNLPDGMAVSEGTALLALAEGAASAQPNYRYYLQEDASARVTAQLAQAAAQNTAGLVAGTALGDSLNVQAITADDPFFDREWHLESMDVIEAWETLFGEGDFDVDTPVTIAVADAAFNVSHSDLAGNIVATYRTDSKGNELGDAGHGTFVAGVLGAVTNNGECVASVTYNACKVYPLCVTSDDGSITTSTVVDAYDRLLEEASRLNVRVVNMSLGSFHDGKVTRSLDPAFYQAIASAREAGIVTVAAACNSSTDCKPPFYAYPSDCDNVVSVINLAQRDNDDGVGRNKGSNYNVTGQKAKNIAAPGTGIYGLSANDDEYSWLTGTSVAAPSVAGALGLLFTEFPDLTVDEAVSKLYSTARDLTQADGTSVGWDVETGYGEVDVAALIDPSEPYLSGDACVAGTSAFAVKINGVEQDASEWTWSSSNPKIANPDAEGVVYAYKSGQAVITATKDGVSAVQTVTVISTVTSKPVYSLFNKKTKQWFYTMSAAKCQKYQDAGWKYKGIAWEAPSYSIDPIYCLYSKKTKQCRYVKDVYTMASLVEAGWTSKGRAFYSDTAKGKKLYRLYNGSTKATRFTTSKKIPDGWTRKSSALFALQ